MAVTQSRNKREGKYVAGWCLNPRWVKRNKRMVPSIRAGAHYNISRRVCKGWESCGVINVLTLREGAFE